MKVERKIALGLFHIMLKNTKVRDFLEGRLGYDEVPTIEDFNSRASDTLKKCEIFLEYVKASVVLFEEELGARERQGEIDFSKPSKKEKEARAKVAKGDPKGRKAAVDALKGKPAKPKAKSKAKGKAKAKKKVAKADFGKGLGE